MLRFEGITKVVGLLGVFTAAGLVGACGDNAAPDGRIIQPPIDGGGPPDAEVPDAAPPDASAPDAGPSFSGTISVQEVTVQGEPALGQGLQVTISFTRDGALGTDSILRYEEEPGMDTGCKVWENTPAGSADVGLNQGTVTITSADGDPLLPDCNYVPTMGYLCIAGGGAGGTISAGPMAGLWAYTDAEMPTTAEQVGRWISISGAATAGNNGNFPIVAAGGPNTILFASANPATAAETLPAAATFTVLAGVGPIPGAMDPAFLEDDDMLTIALASGGDGDFESFSRTFAGSGVGDDFVLDAASAAEIVSVPTDGSAFTIACDSGAGMCGTAFGSILTITTTDTPVTGLPAFVMPPPTNTEIVLRCAEIGATSITVPAEASAFLMGAGATRMQTVFLRDFLQVAANTMAGFPEASTNVVAGHGIIGFTTP